LDRIGDAVGKDNEKSGATSFGSSCGWEKGLTPSRQGDHFPKIQTGSWFLGLRWLDTAWDFPIDALYSHPKLRQAGALHDTLMATKRLGQLLNLG
jgi:hypothetical protein